MSSGVYVRLNHTRKYLRVSLGSTLIEIDGVGLAARLLFLQDGLLMGLSHRIEEMISPTVEAMGFRLVKVDYTGGRNPRLQIMAEDVDSGSMNVENCAKLSRAVSAILDVEDPLSGTYALEVSSPGIDRPLVRFEDFEKFLGFDAKIETSRAIDGRKRFKGRLAEVKEGMIRIETKDQAYDLAYEDIDNAKLLLSDALIATAEGQPKK
jgi:ribosome maturation factor RimP